jgi:hypothetical protein
MTGNRMGSSALRLAGFMMAVRLCAQIGHPPVNADSAIIQDFEKRVNGYLQLRKGVESKLAQLKATPSQEKISHHEDELARAVRAARKGARPGDIFTPRISGEMRHLIAMAVQTGAGKNIRESLRHAEPVQLHLSVNGSYPAHLPLQSTPPSLLANLPMLPAEIEYRVTGQDLILLDTKANLIVDLISGVFS